MESASALGIFRKFPSWPQFFHLIKSPGFFPSGNEQRETSGLLAALRCEATALEVFVRQGAHSDSTDFFIMSEMFHEDLIPTKMDFVFFFEKKETKKRVDISETVKFKMLKHTSSFF